MDNGEVDMFLSESLLSFKRAESKNAARRGSLVKKTKGLELQRKMANAKLSKEECQLRESLRQMKIEQKRTSAVRDVVAKSKEMKRQDVKPEIKKCPSADVDPYPVTFPSIHTQPQQNTKSSPGQMRRRPGTGSSGTRSRSHSFVGKPFRAAPNIETNAMLLDEKVRLQAARVRGRRVSREFEDLNIDTKTGSLNVWKGDSAHSVASHFLARGLTGNDLGGSTSSLSSVEDLYWAGEPEAITSVRRPRKTSKQQSRDAVVKRSISDLQKK